MTSGRKAAVRTAHLMRLCLLCRHLWLVLEQLLKLQLLGLLCLLLLLLQLLRLSWRWCLRLLLLLQEVQQDSLGTLPCTICMLPHRQQVAERGER